jgi:chemotaxis protein CheC
MKKQFSKEKLDALKTVVSIGAGHAATALTQLIKYKVTMAVPSIKFCTLQEAKKAFGPPETLVVTVYLELLGDASGAILYSFKKEDALRLVEMLTGNKVGKARVSGEIVEATIKESAFVLTAAYINALSKLLNMQILVSLPAIAQDMAGAIVDKILIQICKETDLFLAFNTELKITKKKVSGYFFFIPNKESLDKILKAVGG